MFKLNYNRCGEFVIPDMGLSAEDRMPLGKHGALRCRYLKAHRPGLFSRLLLNGQLMHQLHKVDRAAVQRMDILLPQMMTEAGLTEELKNADPLQWAGAMNAIAAQTEEILLAELVYI